MRLFVAVDIDAHTRAQLVGAQAAIQSVLLRAPAPPRVTWVKDEAAHVTLRFIGETAEGGADLIKDALMAGFETPPFDVRWQVIGTFPALREAAGRHPRVIWIGPSADSEPMSALAEEVNRRLDPIVGAGESRPFTPHITLGRVKEPGKAVDWTRALAAARWTPTMSRIAHVTLYASRTSPKGPTYTALCRRTLEP